MKHLSKVSAIALICVVLVACALVDDGKVTREVVVDGGGETETAVPPTTLPNTPTSTATPAPSRTPMPTDVPLPTLFATVTRTPEPTITPWPSATPRPTIDFNRELVWTDEVKVVNQFIGSQIMWSPSHDEFVYVVEPKEGYSRILFTDAINFQPFDITPTELSPYINLLWHPSGDYFFLSAEPIDIETFAWGSPHKWKVQRTDPEIAYLGQGSYYWGWLNDNLRVSERRIGTGIFSIGIFNVETDEGIASTNFDGHVQDVSLNYVILGWEPWNYYTTVAILAQESISPDYADWEFGTYIKFLASPFDDGNKRPFNRFADVLPGTDQILVFTWEEGISDPLGLISGSVPANLQLWDVETDTLTMVAPGGIYGRYSPNGRYLVYLTLQTDSPQLHVLDQTTGEILFTQSAFAEADRDNAEVKAYTTFSPNGRFLTFFNPAHELIIYDLENSEFLAPLTAVSTAILWSPDRIGFLSQDVKPLWSPDSSRFVYQNPTAGLSIFDTRNRTIYPLAISGSDRLLDPQWSFDGTYLSVTILEGWWERETAVLQIP